GPQSGLWPHAISGDLPIVLLRIDDVRDIRLVRQLLLAHEYWQMKLLAVDLVIINERGSSYAQDLQNAIDTAVRSRQARPRLGKRFAQGPLYPLRAYLMSTSAAALLRSVARIELVARLGPLSDQVAHRAPEPVYGRVAHARLRSPPPPRSGITALPRAAAPD